MNETIEEMVAYLLEQYPGFVEDEEDGMTKRHGTDVDLAGEPWWVEARDRGVWRASETGNHRGRFDENDKEEGIWITDVHGLRVRVDSLEVGDERHG